MSMLASTAARVPSTPAISVGFPTNTSLRVTLVTPSQEPVSGVSSYDIERSSDGVNFSLLNNVLPAAFPFVDPTCLSGTKYFYRARGVASYAGYRSAPSVVQNGTTTGGSAFQYKYSANGHWMESGQLASLSNPLVSAKATEIHTLVAGPAQVKGYVGAYYWNLLENAMGQYTFGPIDTDYVQVTGYQSGKVGVGNGPVYVNPRSFGLWMLHEDFFSTGSAAPYCPTYIINGSQFGPSPVGGQFGWWNHAGSNSGSQIAIWRTAVMARLIALGQALATHVLPDGYTMNTSPFVEFIWSMISETAAIPDSGDTTFSSGAYLSALQSLNAAMQTAFPNTIVGMINNYADSAADTNTITQNGVSTLTAGADSDTFGFSSGTGAGSLAGLTWGQQAFIGLLGGQDLRGQLPFIASIQQTETGDLVTYTNADLFKQVDQTLQAQYLLWTNNVQVGSNTDGNYLGTASTIEQWLTNPAGFGGMLFFLTQNALTHTARPRLLI